MAHTTFTFTKTQTNAIMAAATASRTTRLANLPLAEVWRAADGATQEQIRTGFLLRWISADKQCDMEQAEIILSGGKGRNQVDAGAVDRSMAGFRFHIITNGRIEQVEAPVKAKASNHAPVKASKAEAAIIALVLSSMTKARALELLAAAK